MSDREFADVIRDFVCEGLEALAPSERAWAAARIIDPHPIDVHLDAPSDEVETLWLVTDNVEGEAEDYRVIYDPALSTFGLIAPRAGGGSVLIGLYGGFADAVSGM
jgi:hypothetical protein